MVDWSDLMPNAAETGADLERGEGLASLMQSGAVSARELLAGYCRLLYERYGAYEEVSRRTRLDRRTVILLCVAFIFGSLTKPIGSKSTLPTVIV